MAAMARQLSTDVRALWRSADAVCFDVDSTVVQEEGIDVLAEYSGAGEAVAALTKKAMEGGMSYQESLAARLELMKPSRSMLDECLRDHPPPLSPKIAELVAALQAKGKAVYLVSGGFRQLIEPVASQIGVSHDNVIANVLLFDDDKGGQYAGFDQEQPTSKTGGKALALEMLKAKHGYKNIIMVGDGATDMEARPPASAFIGFGGVVTRPAVKEGADWFVTDFEDLIAGLD